MATKPVETEEITPSDLGYMAVEACGGVTKDAVDWMLAWMANNPAWVAEHEATIWRYGVDRIISRLRTDQRGMLTGTATKTNNNAVSSITSFANTLVEGINSNYTRMMDAPIRGGKRIGDATPAEIRESADRFHKDGRTLLRQSTWQFKVAEAAEKNGCGANEPVRNALSAKSFEELWEAANAS